MEIGERIKLQEWVEAQEAAIAAKKIIEKEQRLRKEIMELFFPAPKEGVNAIDMGAGWTLKSTYKIERKIDESVLPAVFQQLRAMGVNPDTLVRVVPALEIKAYKTLLQINPDAARTFDHALTVKPGTATLEVIQTKEAQ